MKMKQRLEPIQNLLWPVSRPSHSPDRRSPIAAGDLRSVLSAGSRDPRRARILDRLVIAHRLVAILFIAWFPYAVSAADAWPQFRGAKGTGVASAGNQIPTSWNADDNVAWKAELPGRGPSSPIVVGGRVFVTCSGGANQDRLYVLAFDTKSGDEVWRREFWATGRTLTHPSSTTAAPTPARVAAVYFT